MLRVDLQNSAAVIVGIRVEGAEILLHLEAHTAVRHHRDRVAAEIGRDTHLRDLVSKGIFEEVEAGFEFLRLFLRGLFLFVRCEIEIVRQNVAELVFIKGVQRLRDEFVDLLGQQQHVKAAVTQHLGLRELGKLLRAAARCVVDVLLRFGHRRAVFLERDELALLVRAELDKILQKLLVHSVVGDEAVLELSAEGGVEFFVLLALIFQQAQQLRLDFLLKVRGDGLQLTGVLQQLTADVEAEVLRVDHAADEAEMLRQEIGAVFHNEHAGGIKLQAVLEVLGVEIIGRFAGDVKQRLISHRALDADVDDACRLLIVEELLPVEALIFLLGDVLFVLLPERNHRIKRLILNDRLVFRLLVVVLVLCLIGLRLLHGALLLDLHLDRVTDIIGVFLHKAAQTVVGQIIAVALVVRIRLQAERDHRTGVFLLTRRDRIAVGTGGLPLPRLVCAVLLRHDRDLLRHHERGIEAHAELADDVDVVLLFHLGLELQRAAVGDGAEVFLHLFPAHADAVIGDGQCARVLIHRETDDEIAAAQADVFIRQRLIGQLVDRV